LLGPPKGHDIEMQEGAGVNGSVDTVPNLSQLLKAVV